MYIGYNLTTGGRAVHVDREGNREFDDTRAAMVEMTKIVAKGKTDAAYLCDDDGNIVGSVVMDWHRRSYWVTAPTAARSRGCRVELPKCGNEVFLAPRYVGQER